MEAGLWRPIGGEALSPAEPGAALVLVGTPIGNLGDLSPRAVEALGAADVIACEDTRHTRALLNHAGLRNKTLVALHEHNERDRAQGLVERMASGERVALVSDAGLPTISDPGAHLVEAAIAAGIAVTVIPGPSAVTAALAVSGLGGGRFCFEGFLPRKGRERSRRLAEIAAEERTTVIFESPRRVGATLADLATACGPDRRVAVVRELTKIFEESFRSTLAQACEHVSSHEPRGEHVIVLEGSAPPGPASGAEVATHVAKLLGEGHSTKQASEEASAALGISRREAYEAALRLRR